jgi:hypothetical protein
MAFHQLLRARVGPHHGADGERELQAEGITKDQIKLMGRETPGKLLMG